MKCVTDGKITRRVTDKEAAELVASKRWKYCPRHMWKKTKEKTNAVR